MSTAPRIVEAHLYGIRYKAWSVVVCAESRSEAAFTFRSWLQTQHGVRVAGTEFSRYGRVQETKHVGDRSLIMGT